MKILRGKYNNFTEFLRFSSGFGWDPETKKFTATDEVWDIFLKDLRTIFAVNTATGQNAVGLGDVVDTGSYQVGESDGIHDLSHVQIMDDVDDIPYEERSVHDVFSALDESRWEKETEEKEVDDKANNVWDAIKEIPDLADDMRYAAMTLVHSLGMKYGFVHMSIEELKGWIIRNLRKPGE
ncbi:PREDICTED: uncharacterized protein At2g29880-like [Camelina sativa]|uniref:Uncharacterized protein At2g29880-like n=1 Tax=Camelina sativa TaxID=90675 RepID=A0ABM0VVI9_CAMSA|nr:PREDICTED: uncharacterized protein At2g29880-like [Camelina sativa]